MALTINNQFLVDSIQSAIATTGLQANVSVNQFSEKSLVARIRFEDQLSIAGELFKPQLYLLNRNDGKTALRLQVGLFRIVCSNGLIMPAFDGSAHQLRIIHRDCDQTNRQIEQLPGLIVAGLDAISSTEGVIEEMKAMELKQDIHAFHVIGNLNVSDNVKRGSMHHWLKRAEVRSADSASDAWSLYNVVNEQIRRNHGFNLTSMKQDSNLLSDVRELVLDVNTFGVAA